MVTPPRPHARVYVCGPMTGYDLWNFPAFDAAAEELRSAGWDVISPAEHDRAGGFDEQRTDFSPQQYKAALEWDLMAIIVCDAIYCLAGWERSKGATTEHTVARVLGKQCLYQVPRNEDEFVYAWNGALPRNSLA